MTIVDGGRIGLIGDPVAHSLSPSFQQPAFDALNIPLRYELLHTPADMLDERIRELRSGDFTGVNVTVPHKEFFFDAVDERSDVAERAGAVNTIICDSGRLYGDNTDVYGFAESLRSIEFGFEQSAALILGAGGAARGVAIALLDSGIQRVIVANRTLDRADRLVKHLADRRLSSCSLDEMPGDVMNVNLIINATSIGWRDDRSPVDRTIFSSLQTSTLAYDLTYRQTPFLNEAREHGLEIMDGLAMLVFQGARSFQLWTDQQPPVEIMMAAALNARSAQ